MKFYHSFIRTFTDVPNHTTLLVHSLSGCPLRCFGCHNYDEIIAHTPEHYKTEKDFYVFLKRSGFLFDAVMFSGGEFLINPIDEIIKLCMKVRKIFPGKIIIATSGIYNVKIKKLYALGLVDGFHIDMKLPYHILDIVEHKSIFEDVIGITPTNQLIDNLLDSINSVIKHNSPLDQVRTVKYPILAAEFFDAIKEYVENRKQHYSSDVPYFLNDFLYV
ncbi:4Fe-4S cluster-binding domain-containing protein [Bacillus sp. FJAT-50079]|uniref:4Fe-4S cluster-binding domain-containing protein n=1 Tax=Bacillus sp. FJAT-50079 TaxID=2833577 RepID=UPI001BCA644D|nr:4Fe-4S cluster-binding domain-containing protein [Bacillus sp. FJAT-50079]MBS4207012.1 4Fe-4S cluster-binding domain-containing protein [Bacillus sp. FJAT-50079]